MAFRLHVPEAFLIACTAVIGPAQAFCFVEAGQRYGIEPGLLAAIAYQETSFKPETISRNTNSTLDIGLMGINTVHLPELGRYGVTPEMLRDPCQSAFAGAYLLKKQILRFGYTWTAVGAYHSRTPHLNVVYQRKIYERWAKLQQLPRATFGSAAPE